jgi:hypothetical protein
VETDGPAHGLLVGHSVQAESRLAERLEQPEEARRGGQGDPDRNQALQQQRRARRRRDPERAKPEPERERIAQPVQDRPGKHLDDESRAAQHVQP